MTHTVGRPLAEITGTGSGSDQTLESLRTAASVSDDDWASVGWMLLQCDAALSFGFHTGGALPFTLVANEWRFFSMTEAIQALVINTTGDFAIELFV